MLKIIVFFNWAIIAILAILVGAETFWPSKGGDAAGRGMGMLVYYVAIAALVVLLLLNLLPYAWPKYLAFGLIILPLLWMQVSRPVHNFFRGLTNWITEKPMYEDAERERIARALLSGKPDKFRKALQNPPPQLGDPAYSYPLLSDAVSWALKFDQPDEVEGRYACIQILLDAGVPIRTPDGEYTPVEVSAASSGNAEMLKFLLERGGNANAKTFDTYTGQPNKVPMIFEALQTSYGARDCIRVMLDFGADPNAILPQYGDEKHNSALMMAASYGRWDICLMLMDKGADVKYRTPDGRSLGTVVAASEPPDQYDRYSTSDDFERVKSRL